MDKESTKVTNIRNFLMSVCVYFLRTQHTHKHPATLLSLQPVKKNSSLIFSSGTMDFDHREHLSAQVTIPKGRTKTTLASPEGYPLGRDDDNIDGWWCEPGLYRTSQGLVHPKLDRWWFSPPIWNIPLSSHWITSPIWIGANIIVKKNVSNHHHLSFFKNKTKVTKQNVKSVCLNKPGDVSSRVQKIKGFSEFRWEVRYTCGFSQ